MKTCDQSECERRHYALGLCQAHWMRRRLGIPLEPPIGSLHHQPGPYHRTLRLLSHRLSEKIIQDDDGSCWGWEGVKNYDGYAQIRIRNKTRRAHMILYELVYGPIPKGKLILHWCGGKCMNFHHLYAGTSKQNRIDALLHATEQHLGEVI